MWQAIYIADAGAIALLVLKHDLAGNWRRIIDILKGPIL